jgi:hypothetical protein
MYLGIGIKHQGPIGFPAAIGSEKILKRHICQYDTAVLLFDDIGFRTGGSGIGACRRKNFQLQG